MDLEKGQLRVYYKSSEDEVDVGLDAALRGLLREYGYELTRSCYVVATGMRDLSFEQVRVLHGEEALRKAVRDLELGGS